MLPAQGTVHQRPRVLIAENQPVFAIGLRHVLEPDVEIIRVLEDGDSIIRMLRQASPDLLLAALTLPDLGGCPLIILAHELAPWTPILAMNTTWTDELIRGYFESGAAGFVGKTVRPEALRSAVLEVLAGRRDVIRLPETPHAQERRWVRDPVVSLLAPKARQVLDLIGLGASSRQIEACLGIKERTVEHYRAEIRAKLGAANPAELYRVALAYTASRNAVEPNRWKGILATTHP